MPWALMRSIRQARCRESVIRRAVNVSVAAYAWSDARTRVVAVTQRGRTSRRRAGQSSSSSPTLRRVARAPWPRPTRRYEVPVPNPRPPGARGRCRRITEGVTARDRGFVTEVVAAAAGVLRGRRRPLDDVPSTSSTRRRSSTRCAHALRAIPRGEVVTYGELAALAGAPGAARAAGTFCAPQPARPLRPVPPRRRRRRARLVRLARRRVQAAPAGARGYALLSDDLRDELAAIAPDATATGSPSSPASSTSPAACTCAAAAASTSTSTSSSSAVARRAFALLRAFEVESEIRTYQQPRFRPRDALPAARRGIGRTPTRRCTGPACSTARTGRSSARRSASSPGAAAAAPTSAARCSAPARSAARATRTSRSAPRKPRARASSPQVAARDGAELHVLDRGSHAVAYAKGTETIADVARRGRRDRRRARARGERGARRDARRREPARERRPREPRAHEPRGARAARGVRQLDVDALPDDLRELALAAAAPPDRLDRRARAPLPPAADEGVGVPPAPAARRSSPRS